MTTPKNTPITPESTISPAKVRRGGTLYVNSNIAAPITQFQIGGVVIISHAATGATAAAYITDSVPLGESEVKVHTVSGTYEVVGRVIVEE